MTDVRLTATNPEDSSVVPVACNAKGELKLEEPQVTSDLYVQKSGDTMTGNLHLADKIILNPDGSAQFANAAIDFYSDGSVDLHGGVKGGNWDSAGGSGTGYFLGETGNIRTRRPSNATSTSTLFAGYKGDGNPVFEVTADGAGFFKGDVIIGSRNTQWMIVESNGLAHLVEQTVSADVSTADLVDPSGKSTVYPPLRNIPGELTMVEEQLQKVMERLKMAPEAGWEVWDGSD